MKTLYTFAFVLLSFVGLAQSYMSLTPMQTGRSAHAVAMINPDQGNFSISNFFICGGWDGGAVTSACEFDGEVYDMNYPRMDHTCNAFGSKILIAGGYDGSSTNYSSTEIFDTQSLEILDGPEMDFGRSYHRSVNLADGRILITGGFDGSNYLSSCEIFDPQTEEFTNTGSMNYARSSHTINLMDDGRVVVTGGFNPAYNFQMVECEIFDPTTGVWTALPSMNYSRDNHGATVYGNYVFVAGGREYNANDNLFQGRQEIEMLDVTSGEWANIGYTLGRHSYNDLHIFNVTDGLVELLIPGSTINSGIDITLTYSNAEVIEVELANPDAYPFYVYIMQGMDPVPLGGSYDYVSISYNVESSSTSLKNEVALFGGLDEFGDMTESGLFYLDYVNVVEQDVLEAAIYPNPTSSTSTIQMEVADQYVVSVVDATGKTISKNTLNGDRLELGNLSSGLYFIHVSNEQGTSTLKWIVN
jgi:hypothetical protein